MSRIDASLLLMIAVIYLVRFLPFAILRRPIRNRFARSFLYYVPYVTLSVMTFPAILTAAKTPAAGVLSLLAGLLVSFTSGNLFATAIACCAAAFLGGMIF